MGRGIISVGQQLDVDVPLFLMIVKVTTQNMKYWTVEFFGLNIGMRMIRAFERVLDSELVEKSLKEL